METYHNVLTDQDFLYTKVVLYSQASVQNSF